MTAVLVRGPMPLRACVSDRDVFAFQVSDSDWKQLKGSSATITMPCCGNRGIPKTSNLGTRFFAHHRRGPCDSKPETREHLLGKTILAQAALIAGWEVSTEVRGASPDNDVWVADVMAEKGRARVALEFQWSSLSPEELRTRQQRYKASGVRGIWFQRARGAGPFHLRITERRTPWFAIKRTPDPVHFTVSAFGLPLGEVARRALMGDLEWEPRLGGTVAKAYVLAPMLCWCCERRPQVLVAEEYSSRRGVLGFLQADLEVAARTVTRERLRDLGCGPLKPRKNAELEPHMSNWCLLCGALQGAHFVDREYRKHAVADFEGCKRIPVGEVPVSQELVQEFARWRLRCSLSVPGAVVSS